jgi:multidrug resistance efflux pump
MTSSYTWEKPFSNSFRFTFYLLLAFVLAGLYWAYWTKTQVYVLVPGSLEPKGQIITLAAPVAGRVTNVRATPWANVQKGEVLFELDALGTNQAQSQLQLGMKEAELSEAEHSLAVAREDVTQQQRLFEQATQLWDAGAIPKNEYLLAQENFNKSRETLAQLEARLETATLAMTQAQQNSSFIITSDTAGRIAQLTVRNEGDIVSYGAPLAEVLPDDVLLIFKALAPESSRPKLKIGSPAEIAWNGLPRQKYGVSQGEVVAISPTVIVKDGRAVYEVEISVASLELTYKDKTQTVLPGMAGEVRIISSRQNVLSLVWDWLRGINKD